MAREYHYVTSYGEIWRMTARNYRRFVRDAATRDDWCLTDYGVCLSEQSLNITNLKQDDFVLEIDDA